MPALRSLRSVRLAPLALAACSTTVVLVSLGTPSSGDYVSGGPVDGDNAAPAIGAILHGSLASYASHQPLMGPLSLLLRAPAVALARALGASNLLQYRLGALACMLAVAALAAWLVARGAKAKARLPGALGACLLLAGPATVAAISEGHPEEPLTAVLCVCAVLAAQRRRPLAAGLALGLALACKEWALIAVVPVALALEGGWPRRRALAMAAAVALALIAPPAIADPGALARDASVLARRGLVNPASVFWLIGAPLHGIGAAEPVRALPGGLTRLRLAAALCAAALAAWCARELWVRRVRAGVAGRGCAGADGRGGGGRVIQVRDPLALLALLGLARACCDPLPQEYYYLAGLVALIAWELLRPGRLATGLPLASLLTSVYVAAVPGGQLAVTPDLRGLLTLLWALGTGAHLLRGAFGVRMPGACGVRLPGACGVRLDGAQPPPRTIASPSSQRSLQTWP